jgi:hypothetical protein
MAKSFQKFHKIGPLWGVFQNGLPIRNFFDWQVRTHSFTKLKKHGASSLSEKEVNQMFGLLCSIRAIEGNVFPTLHSTLLDRKRHFSAS